MRGPGAGHCCMKSAVDLSSRMVKGRSEGNFYALVTRGAPPPPPPPPPPPLPVESGRGALCLSGQLRTLARTYKSIDNLRRAFPGSADVFMFVSQTDSYEKAQLAAFRKYTLC